MEIDTFDRILAIQSKYPELIGDRVDVYENVDYRLDEILIQKL